MYESPIKVYMSDIATEIARKEDEAICFEITRQTGIEVDKDELIKCLAYDRHQYEKGFADAKKEHSWRPRGEWLRGSLWSEGCGMGEQYGYYYICSVCGHEVKGGYTKYNMHFCSKCGSDNLPEEDDEK